MAVKIKKGKGGILDLTPMIDVVFQLMIFFLVATRLEEAERELEVSLPQASEAKPIAIQPKEVFINIDRDGRFVVGGQEMSESQLDAYLGQIAEQGAGAARQRVVLRADRDVRHQFVVTAINLCHKHNIRDFGLPTAEPGS